MHKLLRATGSCSQGPALVGTVTPGLSRGPVRGPSIGGESFWAGLLCTCACSGMLDAVSGSRTAADVF